jgi:2,4-dienoyl-CoA reductase-like NADH-dependent reductase (Old Yellow Enzyme family)
MNTSLKVIGSAYSVLGAAAPIHAEENLRKGYTDFAGFGRQTFADPLYPAKLGRGDKIDYCVACSRCGRLIENQLHTGCAIYNDYYRELNAKLRREQ